VIGVSSRPRAIDRADDTSTRQHRESCRRTRERVVASGGKQRRHPLAGRKGGVDRGLWNDLPEYRSQGAGVARAGAPAYSIHSNHP